jgi:FdhD protein
MKSSATRVMPTKQIGQTNHIRHGDDAVIVEGPLQVLLNGDPLAVTMRTPGEDAALAHGLAVGEGLIRSQAQIVIKVHHCEKFTDAATIDLRVAAADCLAKPRARNQISSASCGLCGIQSLQDVAMPAAVKETLPVIDASYIAGWFSAMENAQNNFRHTGGCHAAALFAADGSMFGCAEDVGRHNAVDKVIGSALQSHRLREACSLVVSGRVSFEIVSKAARAGIGCLAAVSAPSSLAISTAEHCGICLLGFCRGQRFTVYSHVERLVNTEALSHV